jgi:hypothetical protein
MAAQGLAIRFLRRMWFCAPRTLRAGRAHGVGAKDDSRVVPEEYE